VDIRIPRPRRRSGADRIAVAGAGKDLHVVPAPTPELRLDSPDAGPTTQVQIHDVRVSVLDGNQDGSWYQQRKVYEERASLLYTIIAAEGCRSFVDVGANIGYISLLARRGAPDLRLIAVEADPRLARLITRNFADNGLEPPEVVNAVVGDRELDATTFSLNPASTLDNRVHIDDWPQVTVPMRTLDGLLTERSLEGPVFLKIDTQGFEMYVLRGAEGWLGRRSDWVLKMEFAPNWLRSQDTDPAVLLGYLLGRYEVAECPERIPFGTSTIDALFGSPLSPGDARTFVDHVVSLNRAQLGWVDLIVRPRVSTSATG
jgi:FkbM family methyltransferase